MLLLWVDPGGGGPGVWRSSAGKCALRGVGMKTTVGGGDGSGRYSHCSWDGLPWIFYPVGREECGGEGGDDGGGEEIGREEGGKQG